MPTQQASFFCEQCERQRLFTRETPNHLLHLLLTCLCGWWAIIWFLALLSAEPYRCAQCGLEPPKTWVDYLKSAMALLFVVGFTVAFSMFVWQLGKPSTGRDSSEPPRTLPVDTKRAADQAAEEAAAREAERQRLAGIEAKRIADAQAAEVARRAKIKQAADEAAADALMKPANADFSRGAYDEAIRQFKKIAADYPDTKAGRRSQELLDGMKK